MYVTVQPRDVGKFSSHRVGGWVAAFQSVFVVMDVQRKVVCLKHECNKHLCTGTHAMYYKSLKNALVIAAAFMDAIHPIVKSMLDDACEQEMKDKKENELGSWKRAVTVADGIHGWHSKMPKKLSKWCFSLLLL